LNGLTEFQEQGMLLEKALHVALKKLNIPHKHNPFDKRYADKEGKGCDVEILSNKGKIGIEAKNNNGKYGMSPYWLNRECHSRFELEHIIKIFLCAFLTISPGTSEKMKAMGYYLIELGFKVTKENFGRAIHKLIRKLYWIKKSFCFHAKPRLLPMSNREHACITEEDLEVLRKLDDKLCIHCESIKWSFEVCTGKTSLKKFLRLAEIFYKLDAHFLIPNGSKSAFLMLFNAYKSNQCADGYLPCRDDYEVAVERKS